MLHEAAPLYAPQGVEWEGGGGSPHKGLIQSKMPEPEKIVKHHCNYGEDGTITKKYEKYTETVV